MTTTTLDINDLISIAVQSGFSDQDIINAGLSIAEENAKYATGEPMTSSKAVKEYLQLKYQPLKQEVFSIIHLDSQHKVMSFVELFRGTIDAAAVYPRQIVKSCIDNNSSALIIAHNHPSGTPEFSHADTIITDKIKLALKTIDVSLLDHMLVCDKGVVSMAEQGTL